MADTHYPYTEGDLVVIGPECFTDGTVISFKGANYIDQYKMIQLESAVKAALDELGVPGPDYPAPVANAVEILRAALTEQEDTEG